MQKYKEDLAINNQLWVLWHKSQPNIHGKNLKKITDKAKIKRYTKKEWIKRLQTQLP